MILISDYLDKAPSVLLQRIFQRFRQGTGLINNSQVRQEVYHWSIDPSRIEQALAQLDEQELLWLKRFYLDPHGHWNLEKISRLLPASERYRLVPWLDQMSWDFFLARIRQGELRWAPMRELMTAVLEFNQPKCEVDESSFQEMGSYFALHSLRLMAWARLAKLKINLSGDLNQKSLKSLVDSFWSKTEMSNGFAEFEVQFALELMEYGGFLAQADGNLFVKSNFETEIEEVCDWRLRLIELWMHLRGISKNWLGDVMSWLQKPQSAFELSLGMGVQILQKGPVHIESLAVLLREMICLGLVSISKNQSRIDFIRASSMPWLISNDIQPKPVFAAFCTPNFEMHLPCTGIHHAHYWLELLGQLDKENVMLKYNLRKENFFAALAQNLPEEPLKAWIAGLSLSPNVQSALAEWLVQTTGIKCSQVYWLDIEDSALRGRLVGQELVRSHCVGVDPEKGLAVAMGQLETLSGILSTFGMQILQNQKGELKLQDRKRSAPSALTQVMEYDYQHHEPKAAVALNLSESFVFGRHNRELDFGQRLRVLEYAILNDQAVELFDSDGDVSQVFLPVRILRQTNPIRVEGFAGGSEQMSQLDVAEIYSLRLM